MCLQASGPRDPAAATEAWRTDTLTPSKHLPNPPQSETSLAPLPPKKTQQNPKITPQNPTTPPKTPPSAAVIVFSFSKRECEALALSLSSLDLTTDDEKKLVEGVFWSAMDCLGEADRRLPQARLRV